MMSQYLEKNYSALVNAVLKLVDYKDVFKLMKKDSRTLFFNKYYTTKHDIKILLMVIQKKIIELEDNKKITNELFYFYYYYFLTIKYSIERDKLPIEIIQFLNINEVTQKLSKYSNYLIEVEDNIEILKLKSIDPFLKIKEENEVIIETKKDSIILKII
jgi:hypothetical protein